MTKLAWPSWHSWRQTSGSAGKHTADPEVCRHVLVILALVLTPSALHAHAIGLSCRLIGPEVRVEAYFDDDTPARQATITVRDSAGVTVAQGRTDDQGVWTFPRPAAAAYEVTVDAGAGHRAKQQLVVPESTEAPSQLGNGPSRSEFTQVPWRRLAAGLGLIVLAALIFKVGSRWFRTSRCKESPS
jgi:nickel transport protein